MFRLACAPASCSTPHKYFPDGTNGVSPSANLVLRVPVMTDYIPWHLVTHWSSGWEFHVRSM